MEIQPQKKVKIIEYIDIDIDICRQHFCKTKSVMFCAQDLSCRMITL